jgi:hypothetical protein
MRLIDDANILGTVEKRGEPAGASRCFGIRYMNRAKEFSLENFGRKKRRCILAMNGALCLPRKILDRLTLRQLAEYESCRLVGRARPGSELVAVVSTADHSSPMSHACSRSFFE